jgi:ribosome biogenesis GTPase
VYRKSLGIYTVHDDHGQIVTCEASSQLRKDLEGWFEQSASTNIRRKVKDVREIRQVDPIAVGDRVRFAGAGADEHGPRGLIAEVLPRRNKLSRMEPGLKRREQLIVANVDQIIPVFSARSPEPKWALLDRTLACSEEAGIPALIVITKSDLIHKGALDARLNIYREIGYRVLLTSAAHGGGIDALARVLRNKISVVIGLSGVGKSSLLNAVQPGLGLRVKAINDALGKGRHTTTHAELYPLDTGGAVVDTPGMKLFGLYHMQGADVSEYYREMRPYRGSCRFGMDCSHIHEPGCAILAAVDAGAISQERYESYVYLRDHLEPEY